MKVILLQDIARLGKRGEVKDVAEGYAINVLIAKKQALLATAGELAKWKQKEDSKKHKKELETSIFAQLVDKLRQDKIVITGKKADAKGQLFAQIKEVDIVDAIFNLAHVSIDAKQIIIATPIKSLGDHTVELKQGNSKEKISIEVK